MKNFSQNVKKWAIDRNLHTGDPKNQYLKLMEEYGEIYTGLRKNSLNEIMDGIGDTLVVFNVLAAQLNIDLEECRKLGSIVTFGTLPEQFGAIAGCLARGKQNELLTYIGNAVVTLENLTQLGSFKIDLSACQEMAWNAIKDRKGMLLNGVFVKYDDLPEDLKAKFK